MQNNIPKNTDVVIIGAGPAGTSAATHLVKAGINVVILEKTQFPRQQVGESLIPHFWKFTDALGVSDTIKAEGFINKAGGLSIWEEKVQQILFSDFGYTRSGLHVERDVFDDLLLKHSERMGAIVFQQINVQKVDFSRPNSPAIYFSDQRNSEKKQGIINCTYVIDASGHRSLLAQQFKCRHLISPEKNFLALWGYFKNSRYAGTDYRSHSMRSIKKNRPVTFIMSYKEGWLWHIILRNKASVGLIIHPKHAKNFNKQQREIFFKQQCQSLPYLKDLLSDARFIENSISHRPDYSYYSTQLCGENYYCIGDAAAFTDPIFSHGIQNAFYNAALASCTIQASFNNPLKRQRYSQLCASRMQQYYYFSSALSLGDLNQNTHQQALVQSLMKTMPALELELMLAAANTTNRSENFKKLAIKAGIWNNFIAKSQGESLTQLTQLDF
ncbi:MAG: tryptophan 7-halogenase [Methylococcales bacterium]|nr:tryptophan 7-halogenase [Methylococcales bacterium]MCK5924952.1 tryptophan 7-halogenase [Methylococcales bacterium]